MILPDHPSLRIGWGSDVHRLAGGDGIVLGGIRIPCPFRCEAVSDGDVLLHALTDALLGAGGLGDIGEHFPESSVTTGEDSRRFVRHAAVLLAAKGGRVLNADCVINLEQPKLGAYKQTMRASAAELLGIPPDRVNIKAKTGEGLDAVGTGRAVSAEAVVLVSMGP